MLTDFFKVIRKGDPKSANEKKGDEKKEKKIVVAKRKSKEAEKISTEALKEKEEEKEKDEIEIGEEEEETVAPQRKRLRKNVIDDSDSDDDDGDKVMAEEKNVKTEEHKAENTNDNDTSNNEVKKEEKTNKSEEAAECDVDDAVDECETAATTSTNDDSNNNNNNNKEEEENDGGDDDDDDEGESEDGYSSRDETEEKKESKKKVSKTKTASSSNNSNSKGKVKGKYAQIKYDVVKDAGFKAGADVPYLVLAQTFEKIEGTTLRLAKTEYLANLFRSIIQLTPRDLLPAIYLILGKVAPDYTGVELGIGDSLLIKAVAEATGTTPEKVKQAIHDLGDLGRVASAKKQRVRSILPPQPLTVKTVFASLKEIATSSGSQSRDRKAKTVTRLLVSCRECEPQYVIRMLQGKFRIGCSEKTVLAALARALVLSPPQNPADVTKKSDDVKQTATATANEQTQKEAQRKGFSGSPEALAAEVGRVHAALTRALSLVPCYDDVIPMVLEPGGVETLGERCQIRPGMPVHPMLAQPTKGVGEVLTRLEKVGFTCEYKYDGERAQIHVFREKAQKGGKLTARVYSRNLEESSAKFPDVIRAVLAAAPPDLESCIIDSEAVGWDPVARKLLPFQTLSHRARKSVSLEEVKISVCVFAFDLLYLNGRSLINEPYKARRQALHDTFTPTEGAFVFATYKNIIPGEGEVSDIQPFLEEAVANQCEGLMVKTYDAQSEYLPNQRSYNWLKIKKDYMVKKNREKNTTFVYVCVWAICFLSIE